jgi:hypothetical protein
LRAVGAGFATLPFFRLVENSFAQSMGESLPLKFIGIYHPHGVSAEYWAMREGETETSFDIKYENCSLQPFDDAATYGKSFKNKIIVIEGIDHQSNAGGHESAGTMLTGSQIASQKPLNSSIDQYLAVEKGLGASTRVTSIALAVGNVDKASGHSISFGKGGEALSKVIDPRAAFDQLFAGLVVGNDPGAQAAAERERRLGKSVLDFVKADINRLHRRLAPGEQQKLDQHLTSLREIEKQFEAPAPGGGGTTTPMTGLTAPDSSKFPKLQQWNGGEPYFDAITDAHIEILAQAIASDVTRFATLFMNDLSYEGNPLGLGKSTHDDVAHFYQGSPVGSNGRPGDGTPATWLPLAKFNRYSYGKIARLMQKLDGLGALDSTLIYAASDMGNPSLHSTRNVPTLIAGGANGKFRMGRRLRMKTDCPMVPSWCSETDAGYTTVSNNHVLVSILQAFGVAEDSFGMQPSKPQDASGALSGLA